MLSDPQFWVAVAFVVFVLAIFNPIRKILNSSLDNKINEIKNSIEEAENLKNETQLSLSDIKKRQNEVKSEIKQIHFKANHQIKSLENEMSEKLKNQIAKRKFQAKAKIEQLSRDTVNSIQKNISITAIIASTTLLKSKLNKEDKQNLINKSINDIKLAIKT